VHITIENVQLFFPTAVARLGKFGAGRIISDLLIIEPAPL